MFGLNLLFTIAWIAITGELSIGNFAFGFVLSFAMLYFVQRTIEPRERALDYFQRVFAMLDLGFYFFWSVIAANGRMVIVVLSPTSRLAPAIVRIPLDIDNHAAITLLANWITLTPGTLSLDVSDEFDALFVHTIDGGDDPDAFRRTIKMQFERRVKKVFE